ncbi:hypothetical protein NM688_g1722 [Phlebia brevispora]|uniref:Uncharacterized protein n=1 Tax=Phlebia brevispora TaxID=194682 RepID=A0ACC1TAQ3_9APHY|nr:hypothetical protein NM688_g1722 [Phlebia brevispora]
MSSHALLVMHNLAVMDTFFAGVRDVLSKSAGIETFNAEIDRFVATYSEAMTILEEASVDWTKVDRARGKGRLMREKAEADSAG